MQRNRAEYRIQTVTNFLMVIGALAAAPNGMGVTELANKFGIHKNNVFRLLSTAMLDGWVVEMEEVYRLGPGATAFAQAAALLHASEVTTRREMVRDAAGVVVGINTTVLLNGAGAALQEGVATAS